VLGREMRVPHRHLNSGVPEKIGHGSQVYSLHYQSGKNGEGFIVVLVPSTSNRWANVAHFPKTSAAEVP